MQGWPCSVPGVARCPTAVLRLPLQSTGRRAVSTAMSTACASRACTSVSPPPRPAWPSPIWNTPPWSTRVPLLDLPEGGWTRVVASQCGHASLLCWVLIHSEARPGLPGPHLSCPGQGLDHPWDPTTTRVPGIGGSRRPVLKGRDRLQTSDAKEGVWVRPRAVGQGQQNAVDAASQGNAPPPQVPLHTGDCCAEPSPGLPVAGPPKHNPEGDPREADWTARGPGPTGHLQALRQTAASPGAERPATWSNAGPPSPGT